DPAVALALGDVGGERARRLPCEALGDRASEREAVVPAGTTIDRDDEVQPLPSRGLEEARETQLAELAPQRPRRRDHVAPGHAVAGIEVEHQSVWLLQMLRRRVPGVDLENADLHEADEPWQIVDDEVLADLLLLPDADAAQRRGRPRSDVLLVEALLR